MAQSAYRANVSASTWPHRIKQVGRTVIAPVYETGAVKKPELPSSEERDITTPNVYYLENVVPNNFGFTSVGYVPVITSAIFPNAGEYFLKIVEGRASWMTKIYIAITSRGNLYTCIAGVHGWQISGISTTHAENSLYTLSVANINDKIFIHANAVGWYKVSETTQDLVAATVTGLDGVSTRGILSTTNYLITWDATTVYWGALEDPTDFTPSTITGAGYGIVQAAQGAIITCVATTLGFIIYCENNAICALATSKDEEPFTLRDVSGSGGISVPTQVINNWNSLEQYAWTGSGLQLLNSTTARGFLADFTDFIRMGIVDYYDTSGNVVEETWAATDVKVQLTQDRYIWVSYKKTTDSYYSWAIVYDLYLRRVGRIKVQHIEIFDWFSATTILAPDGTISVIKANYGDGRIALGKFQHQRQRMMKLDSIEIEDVTGTPDVKDITTLNGNTVSGVYTGTQNSSGTKFFFSCVGLNHSILISGTFEINAIVLHYHIHGRA